MPPYLRTRQRYRLHPVEGSYTLSASASVLVHGTLGAAERDRSGTSLGFFGLVIIIQTLNSLEIKMVKGTLQKTAA